MVWVHVYVPRLKQLCLFSFPYKRPKRIVEPRKPGYFTPVYIQARSDPWNWYSNTSIILFGARTISESRSNDLQ